MKKRVVVAMSGGVDSSVAAALLKNQGYEVIGITMCFNLSDKVSKKPRCCGWEGIEDARRVAYKLGIRHYVLNMQKALQAEVIEDFCKEYLSGRTPNPCVRCNQYLKFGILLRKANALGAQYLATGHYARIAGFNRLKKAKDKKKDQSYFLYRLNQEQLKRSLFPLGNYTKSQVRHLAKEFALPVADKLASQEICFLPDDDYRTFLSSRLSSRSLKPGPIIDKQGNILGRHKGIAFYTIGQRQGLNIAMGYPIYIAKIDSRHNRIVVGPKEEILASEFIIKNVHFTLGPIKKKIVANVKIRYNHKEAPAEILPGVRKTKVKFKKPQFAITPGQSAVFYKKDQVLGGGVIEEVLN